MNAKISTEELHRLRNEIPLQQIIYALRVPWKWDDQLLRFKCPKCGQYQTSIHPSENLGRCFDCKVNFNSIDFVCHVKVVKFRTAVEWLRILKRSMEEKDYSTFMIRMARQSMVK